MPPPRSFADFDYEPQTPEEVAEDWAGKPDEFADAFFGTDEIDRVTETLFTVWGCMVCQLTAAALPHGCTYHAPSISTTTHHPPSRRM